MAQPTIQTYFRAKKVIEIVHFLKMILSGELTRVVADQLRDSRRMLRRELAGEIEDIPAALGRNMDEVLLYVAEVWTQSLLVHGASITAYLIYLPVPFPTGGERVIDTRTKIGSGALARPIKLVLGASGSRWGRVIGMGLGFPDRNRQIWRMDYHPFHGSETGDAVTPWRDSDNPRFHFHVQGY